ncbi:MAG: NapC/NirT family cytochrome c [Euryarchaeota archaeon]|nr:NapC/NirT family cytochrome c [Euryarchaeota archaeon]
MKNISLLLLIAVILVGLFALPNALSLFSGQHSFDKAGNGTICVKCHSDVAAELAGSAYHKSITIGPDKCKACHTAGIISANLIPLGNGTNGSTNVGVGLNITNGNFTYANGTNRTNLKLHAAVTLECVSCHYGVNFTDDAHKPFYDNTSSKVWLKGANEACYGCHTKVNVQMTWIRKGGYNYSYEFNTTTGTLMFNATDVTTHTNNTG